MVELETHADDYVRRFDELSERARYLLSSQIRDDSNKHAREDTGILKLSAYKASNLPKGEIVWDTPYAKRVYFTGTPSTDKNPDAELMWVQVAVDRYGKDWVLIFENLAKKEILK